MTISCSGLGSNTTARLGKDYKNCFSGEEKWLAITPTAGNLLKRTAAINLLFWTVIYKCNTIECVCVLEILGPYVSVQAQHKKKQTQTSTACTQWAHSHLHKDQCVGAVPVEEMDLQPSTASLLKKENAKHLNSLAKYTGRPKHS